MWTKPNMITKAKISNMAFVRCEVLEKKHGFSITDLLQVGMKYSIEDCYLYGHFSALGEVEHMVRPTFSNKDP